MVTRMYRFHHDVFLYFMSVVFHKLWFFLRTYILTVPRFDLFLQGSLLILIMLDTNTMLHLRRYIGTGYLPAMIEDWTYIGKGVIEFACGMFVAWWGRRRRQFALAGWLGVTAISGLLIMAFPYPNSAVPSVDLCGGGSISLYSEEPAEDNLAVPRLVFLVISSALCSLCMVSIWSHGLSYLDDHEPQNGPYFYGILISIRLSLGLSGQNWLLPGSLREDWWEAQISLSMLTLMFAVLFLFFPRKMKFYKEPDVIEDTGFLPSVYRILNNKAIVVQSLSLSLLYVAIFSFVRYDKNYVQARFHIESVKQDPQTSRAVSDIFRSMVVIFFVMVFRMRFSVRRSDGVKANTAAKVGGVVAVFVAIMFAVIASLPCQLKDIAGYEDGLINTPACSADCGCDSGSSGFLPVCSLDTSVTYFSPCDAGCQEYEDLNGFILFQNCTCGSGSSRAVRGSCSLSNCRASFSMYQVFFTLAIAITAAALLMQGMVILRAPSQHDKGVAMGTSFAITGIMQVPGHLLYMLISELTCAFEGAPGSACAMHRPTLWILPAVSAALALCSAIISIIASRFKEPGGPKEDINTISGPTS